MMNHMEIIENELKLLQTETKKKFNTIKDVKYYFKHPQKLLNRHLMMHKSILAISKKSLKRNKALVNIIRISFNNSIYTVKFPINEILKPILMIPSTKNTNMMAIGLSVVQKLITYDLLQDVF